MSDLDFIKHREAIRERRTALSTQISEAIGDFMKETGLRVESIDVTDVSSMCGNEPPIVSVHLQIP